MVDEHTKIPSHETEGPPSLALRLRKCIESNGGLRMFSAKTGIPVRTLSNYISGRNEPKVSSLLDIANAAEVSLDWLATGNGSMKPEECEFVSDQPQQPCDEDHLIPLPIMNVTASAGGGSVVMHEKKVGVIGFDPAWLRSTWNVNPNDLFTLPTSGESMEPTIKAGEYLLCSRSEEATKPGDGIYVIRLEGDILVKRIQRLPGAKLRISSDNDAYQPYEIPLDDGIDFKILGKVVLVHGLRRV